MTETNSPNRPRPALAVLDYGMGNLRSVLKAWEHAGAAPYLVEDPADLGTPDALVFPGQGAIVDTMVLLQRTGFDRVLRDWIEADKPFFGICLGLQALFEHSEEGDTPGLGIFPGEVKRFRFPPKLNLKVPHMGWNTVDFVAAAPVATPHAADGSAPYFYFVHSFQVAETAREIVWGETSYGPTTFVSAIRRGRCYATQFHPEKSQRVGLELYGNFLATL
ncbi:MAG: imidazole glycerol phosphate synthase subunit HisH [Opitutales bacterium]